MHPGGYTQQRLRWNALTGNYEYEDPTGLLEVDGEVWAEACQQRQADGMSEGQAEEETLDARRWPEDLDGVTFTPYPTQNT